VDGGARRGRTADLVIANDALSRRSLRSLNEDRLISTTFADYDLLLSYGKSHFLVIRSASCDQSVTAEGDSQTP